MKTHLACMAAALIALIPTISHGAPQRTLNIRAVTMAGVYPGSELYAHSGSKDPGAKVNVKTFLNHEFDAVKLESGSLVLTTKPDPSSVADKSAMVAEFKIAAGMKSCVILFLPGATEETGSAELIDDSKAGFPPGCALVINSTKTDLRLKLETKDFDVKGGSRLLIKDPPAGANNSTAVEVFSNAAGTLTLISSSTWPHPGTKRVIQIATEGRGSGKPEMRGLKDIVTLK